jgi:predicted peroxiredoxin
LTFVLIALTGVAKVAAEQPRDGVFIHVSHGGDDPHRVLMALSMASIMSEDRDVLVYFDIKGIDVVLKNSDDLTYSHFPSSKTQLAALPKKGVILMACPGCLKAADKTAADLARRADRRQGPLLLVHQGKNSDLGLLTCRGAQAKRWTFCSCPLPSRQSAVEVAGVRARRRWLGDRMLPLRPVPGLRPSSNVRLAGTG